MAKITYGELDPADRDLVERAREASARAYAPYSGFAVGAAVRTVSGRVHLGANLENASYGVAICAELAAVIAARLAEDVAIAAIAVAGHRFLSPENASRLVTPCGRCRQAISEAAQLAGSDVRVLSCSGDLHKIEIASISELLPAAFGPATLGLEQEWPQMRERLRAAVAALAAARPPG